MPQMELKGHFSNGLRPEEDMAVGSEVLTRCKNLKPSPRGLVGLEPIISPEEVLTPRWPYPMAFKGSKHRVTADETALYVDGVETPLWSYASAVSETPGLECCAGGTMADPSVWTLGASWTFDAGRLLHQGSGVALASQGVAQQTIPLVAGTVYRVTFTLSGVTGGSVRVSLGDSLSRPYGANGTYVVHLKATGTTLGINFTPAASFTGYIDNLSVRYLDEGALVDGGGLWEFDDFGEVWFLRNNKHLVVQSPSLAAGEPVLCQLSDGILAGVGCVAAGRWVLGALEGSRLATEEFLGLWDYWKTQNPATVTTGASAVEPTTLFYSAPFGGDQDYPFLLEMALLGLVPRTSLGADLLTATREALTKGAMGFVRVPGTGTPLTLKPLGGGVVLYGYDSVHFVDFSQGTPRVVELLKLGVLAKGAVAGDEREHKFWDSEGVLWKVGADLQVTRLGYQEFGVQLLEGLVGEGVNSLTDDWLLMEGWTAFEGGLAHNGGTAPSQPTLPVAIATVDEIDWYAAAKATSYGGLELTTGMVPFPVFFEGWQSTEREDITGWVWDFGDGSAEFAGFNAAHIYETPGVYTVTLTVTNKDGGTATDTLTITATARTGGTIYYVDSATGSDSNDGLSEGAPWLTADKAFGGMVSGRYTIGDSILFKRGGTYGLAAGTIKPWESSQHYGYYFGAYGSGAKPIIKHTGTSTAELVRLGYNGLAWWGCVDLAFDCQSATGQVSSCFIAVARCTQIFFLRCDIHNHKQAIGFNGDHLTRKISNAYIIECHIYDSIGTDAMHTYTKAARYAVISSTFGFCDDHVGYHSYLNKAIFALNTYDEWAFGRLAIRSCGVTNAANPTNNVHIIGNTFTGWIDPVSDTWAHTGNGIRYNICAIELGPNVGSDQYMEYGLVEWNTFVNVEKFIEIGDWEHVKVRNNTMSTVSVAAGNPRIQIGHPYEHRPVLDIEIYANTITSAEARLGTAGIFWVGWYGWGGTPYSDRTVHTDINIHHNKVTISGGDARLYTISTQSAAQRAEVVTDYNVMVGTAAPTTDKLIQLGGSYVAPEVTLTLAEWLTLTGNDAHSEIYTSGSHAILTPATTLIPMSVNAGSAYQTFDLQVVEHEVSSGQTYTVTATLRGRTQGAVSLLLGGTVVVEDWSTLETRSWVVRCGTENGTLVVTPTVDFDGSIYDLSVILTSELVGSYDPNLGDCYWANGGKGFVLSPSGMGEITILPTSLYRLGRYLYGYAHDLEDGEVLVETEEFDMGSSTEKLIQLIDLGSLYLDDLKAGLWGRVGMQGSRLFGPYPVNRAGVLQKGITAKAFALRVVGTLNSETQPKLERVLVNYKQIGRRGF